MSTFVQALRELLMPVETQELSPTADHEGRVTYMLNQLLRKPFRRRVSIDTRFRMARKIAACVEHDRPVVLVVPFGGYKHYWNRSRPRPDWAEYFHLHMMREYLGPLVRVHPPGVSVEYVSEDFIVPRMDNYPPADIEEYADGFRDLLSWVNPRLPTNMRFSFWRLQERYDAQAISEAVDASIPTATAAFSRLPVHLQAHELTRSARSVYWEGHVDLTSLRPAERHNRVVEARLYEKMFAEIAFGGRFVGGYYDEDDRIMLCFSWGLSTDNFRGFLAVQTAHGSGVDFWIGRGVLTETQAGIRPVILSRKQYEGALSNVHTMETKSAGDKPPGDNYTSIDCVTSTES
jgi:hypothetical protein